MAISKENGARPIPNEIIHEGCVKNHLVQYRYLEFTSKTLFIGDPIPYENAYEIKYLAEFPLIQDTSIDQCDEINDHDYMYGFILNDDHKLKFFCDSPNKRWDWITHIQDAVFQLQLKQNAIHGIIRIVIERSTNEVGDRHDDIDLTQVRSTKSIELPADQSLANDAQTFNESEHKQKTSEDSFNDDNMSLNHCDRNDTSKCDANCTKMKEISAMVSSYRRWIDMRISHSSHISINKHLENDGINIKTCLDCYHHCLQNYDTHLIDINQKCDEKYNFSVRNNRETYFNDGIKNEASIRTNMFFGYYQPKDVHLIQLMDTICYGLSTASHRSHTTTSDFRKNRLKNKFIIDVQDEKTNAFEFGIDFRYYDAYKDHRNYVQPHYKTLKEELLCNYLTPLQFSTFYQKSLTHLKAEFTQKMKIKNIGRLNNQAAVRNDEPLRVNHMICMLTYTDFSYLQREFKKTWRKKSDAETDDEINKRHSFIYYWAKYLYEIVFFYGQYMNAKERVFVGFNRKLLFNQVQAGFFGPLSTSKSYTEASGFAGVNGVTFELKRYDDRVRYFDAFMVSAHPHEKEAFFCSSELKITQFQFQWMDWFGEIECNAINLFRRILNGNLFMHCNDLVNDTVCNTLIHFIKRYISKNTDPSETPYDTYSEKIFLFTLNSYLLKKFQIWFNISELQKLSHKYNALCSYFYDVNSIDKHGVLIQIMDHLQINAIHPSIHELDDEQIVTLCSSHPDGICLGECTVMNDTVADTPLKFIFDLMLKQSPMDKAWFSLFVGLKSLDKRVKSVDTSWDVVIDEFSQFEMHSMKSSFNKDTTSDGFHVFPRSTLDDTNFKTLKFHFNIKIYRIDLRK
eukprot:69947_1